MLSKIMVLNQCLVVLGFIINSSTSHSQTNRPNIIVIMVDDLGYGDIGAYNDEIDFTPHIDQLAREGMIWTDFHSNGPMCSPTRAAFLTGKYQYRFGEKFEGALSSRNKDKGLPTTVTTIPGYLKRYGYTTGLFGKWHLGFEEPYLPNNYGFDLFKGLLSGDGDHHSHINRWGLEDWWRNKELNMVKGYSTNIITDDSIDFIERNKDRPFFLFVSYLTIHFPWQGPQDPPQRIKGRNYTDDKWGIIADEKNVRPHVIEMIKSLDDSVFKIRNKLKELNIDKNTMIIFTSDNGGYTHYYQGNRKFENISVNDPLRGQKTDVYEGGHRVPFIAYWPGKIEGGISNEHTAMSMDLFPTFAAAINETNAYINGLDGESLWSAFQNKGGNKIRYLYWKIGNNYAVRYGPWKLVMNGSESELYHLDNDIGENHNLSREKPGMINQLNAAYHKWIEQVNLEKED